MTIIFLEKIKVREWTVSKAHIRGLLETVVNDVNVTVFLGVQLIFLTKLQKSFLYQ